MEMPIIELKISELRSTIMLALTERQMQWDSYIVKAVAEQTSPEKIQEMVEENVKRIIPKIVAEAVSSRLAYGGLMREIVKAKVNKELYTMFPDLEGLG